MSVATATVAAAGTNTATDASNGLDLHHLSVSYTLRDNLIGRTLKITCSNCSDPPIYTENNSTEQTSQYHLPHHQPHRWSIPSLLLNGDAKISAEVG